MSRNSLRSQETRQAEIVPYLSHDFEHVRFTIYVQPDEACFAQKCPEVIPILSATQQHRLAAPEWLLSVTAAVELGRALWQSVVYGEDWEVPQHSSGLSREV